MVSKYCRRVLNNESSCQFPENLGLSFQSRQDSNQNKPADTVFSSSTMIVKGAERKSLSRVR